jgi:hypothetical protein
VACGKNRIIEAISLQNPVRLRKFATPFDRVISPLEAMLISKEGIHFLKKKKPIYVCYRSNFLSGGNGT